MNILKDRQICEDDWLHLDDNTALAPGNIILSLSHFLSADLHSHNGKIGVRIAPTDDLDCLKDHLNTISLIALDFPAFTDGRGFSQARLLRNLHGFQGQIRAIGNFTSQQVFYLARVGVNAFQMPTNSDLTAALASLDDFSVHYQPSSD